MLFVKKAFNDVFKSSKNEELTLAHDFIFVFIQYLIGPTLSEKSYEKRGVRKKYEKEEWPYRGSLSIEGGFKPSAYCDIERLKGGTLEY